ncbi:MAG: rhomboid family intramembrane serine protease [Chloroflexota bacterium]|nr:rhomboid family intramembrane serine protease [Chloroflexota bacterium]
MIPISDANRTQRFPFVNLSLILVNILVFLYEVTLSNSLTLTQTTRDLVMFFNQWAVVPSEYTGGPSVPPDVTPVFLTLFTAMFMHGSLLHIGSNMLFLWVFGDNVESNMGHLKYLVFYLISGVLASAAHILFNLGSAVPSLGASGAIAGVLGAYLVLFPRAQVRTLIILFIFITMTRVSAVVLIGIWFLLQFAQGIIELGMPRGETGGVAVWAHVGGFIAGVLLVFVFRGRRKRFERGDYVAGPPGTGYSS